MALGWRAVMLVVGVAATVGACGGIAVVDVEMTDRGCGTAEECCQQVIDQRAACQGRDPLPCGLHTMFGECRDAMESWYRCMAEEPSTIVCDPASPAQLTMDCRPCAAEVEWVDSTCPPEQPSIGVLCTMR